MKTLGRIKLNKLNREELDSGRWNAGLWLWLQL